MGLTYSLMDPDGRKYGGNQANDCNNQKYRLDSLPHACVKLNCPFDRLRGRPTLRQARGPLLVPELVELKVPELIEGQN